MADLPQSLRELQDLDGQMARFLEQRNRDGLVVYQEEHLALSSRLATTVARLTELRMALAECERQLEAQNLDLEKLEKELRGRLASYEESILLSRLESRRVEKSGTEDQLLELMLALEELQPQEMPLRSKLAEAETELQEAMEEEEARIVALDQRLADCRLRRQALLVALPSEIARAYETAFERNGVGLDAAKNGRCNRCRMQLADQHQRQLRLSQAVVCPSCQIVLINTLVGVSGIRSQ